MELEIKQTPGVGKSPTEARSTTDSLFSEGDGVSDNLLRNKDDFRANATSEGGLVTGSGMEKGYDHLGAGENDTSGGGEKQGTKISKLEWITMVILVFVNLLNYMDRFTLAGVLDDVKETFGIEKSQQGLLQTVFLVSYMVFAPIFGYVGDRHSRKITMSVGVLLWSVATLAGSFVDNSFEWFVVFRAIVGIGEASFSTIAPTVISDIFLDDVRSRMLALFYFAIPVGGGLGYIVGAQAAKLGGAWYWSLRVTPVLGIISVIFMLFLMIDPPRGEREGSTKLKATSWGEDMTYLCKNKSFMLSTLGFTCVCFVTGALSWWGPTYIYYGLRLHEDGGGSEQSTVSFYFGAITMLAGIIGVPLGAVMATKLRARNWRADPLICAVGILVSTPLIFGGAVLAKASEVWCYVLLFVGEIFLNLNWAIVADMLLYIVIPTRRSTGTAFQILLSHALGDAGSPYLVGQIAEWFKESLAEKAVNINGSQTGSVSSDQLLEYESLQYSLLTTALVQILGGLFFLATAWYIIDDKKNCDRIISQSPGGHLIHEMAPDSQTESKIEIKKEKSSTEP